MPTLRGSPAPFDLSTRKLRSRLRHTALIAVFAFVLAALAAGCGKPPHAALPSGSTVVALGDSLTWGTGATPETSYPAELARTSGWNVVNAGVPGNTAAEGCARLAPLLIEERPALVLVFLGGNDFLRRRPAQEIADGLSQCLGDARAAGVPLVLLGVPTFGLTGLDDAALYAEFADANRVPLVSPGLGALLRDASRRADPIHLNGDGYRALAGNVAAGLRRLGFLPGS